MDRRTEILNNRRVERLRSELIQIFGFTNIQLIDAKVSTSIRIFSQGRTYNEVLNVLKNDIQQQLNGRQSVPEPSEPMQTPKPMVQSSSRRQITPQSSRRELPMHARNKEVDEWGAVLRQQDIAVQQAEVQRKQLLSVRQREYKKELDNIWASDSDNQARIAAQQQGEKMQLAKYAADADYNHFYKTEAERQNRYDISKLNDKINIKNKMLRESNENQLRRNEATNYNQYCQSEAEREQEANRNRDMAVKSFRNEMNQANSLLLESKRAKVVHERELEYHQNKTGLETNDSNEPRRQKFLQSHQEYVQRLEKSPFNMGRSPTQLSPEEQRRIQEHQVREAENHMNQENQFKIRKIQDQNDMVQSLNRQVKERNDRMLQDHRVDADYGVVMKQEYADQRNRDHNMHSERMQKQRMYSQELQKQIDQTQTAKRLDHQMTEAERRLNQRDIEAFKQQSTENAAKIPGVNVSYDFGRAPRQRSDNTLRKSMEYEAPIAKRHMVKMLDQSASGLDNRSKSTTPGLQQSGPMGSLKSSEFRVSHSPSPMPIKPQQFSIFKSAAGRMIS